MTISRREILYLFEAYAALLRAGSAVTEDVQWLAQVEENEGLILSIDGIQPDKGNETIYVVRDVLTDRVLVAEKVGLSSTETMKQLLAPVKALGLPVLGIISDAQDSEVLAIAQLWPEAPHQLCQFHVLRQAGRPAYEADREVKTAMRKVIGRKVVIFVDGSPRWPSQQGRQKPSNWQFWTTMQERCKPRSTAMASSPLTMRG